MGFMNGFRCRPRSLHPGSTSTLFNPFSPKKFYRLEKKGAAARDGLPVDKGTRQTEVVRRGYGNGSVDHPSPGERWERGEALAADLLVQPKIWEGPP